MLKNFLKQVPLTCHLIFLFFVIGYGTQATCILLINFMVYPLSSMLPSSQNILSEYFKSEAFESFTKSHTPNLPFQITTSLLSAFLISPSITGKYFLTSFFLLLFFLLVLSPPPVIFTWAPAASHHQRFKLDKQCHYPGGSGGKLKFLLDVQDPRLFNILLPRLVERTFYIPFSQKNALTIEGHVVIRH